MLWAYRTASRQPTGETPFTMTYKTEVVIPTELGLHTLLVVRRNLDRVL